MFAKFIMVVKYYNDKIYVQNLATQKKILMVDLVSLHKSNGIPSDDGKIVRFKWTKTGDYFCTEVNSAAGLTFFIVHQIAANNETRLESQHNDEILKGLEVNPQDEKLFGVDNQNRKLLIKTFKSTNMNFCVFANMQCVF